MATQTVTGYITVTDVADGRGGITVVLSNENHTFAADPQGAVATAVRNAFRSRIEVYVETTKYDYEASGGTTPTAGKWSLGTIAVTDASGVTTTVTADTNDPAKFADLTLGQAGGTGFFQGGSNSPDSVTITLPIYLTIGANTVSVTRSITLSKAKGGSASLLTLTQTDYLLPITTSGNTRSARDGTQTIVFDAELENISGTNNVTWESRVGSGSWATISTGTQSQSRNTRLTLTHAQLLGLIGNTARSITIRATLGGKSDLGSVGVVEDGQAGVTEVIARLIARGSTVLRNSLASSTVTIEGRIFYKGSDASTAITARQWFVRANNANTNISGARGTATTLTVTAADTFVAGGAALIGCTISYDDTNSAVTG